LVVAPLSARKVALALRMPCAEHCDNPASLQALSNPVLDAKRFPSIRTRRVSLWQARS
jgi:hypothetical protein